MLIIYPSNSSGRPEELGRQGDSPKRTLENCQNDLGVQINRWERGVEGNAIRGGAGEKLGNGFPRPAHVVEKLGLKVGFQIDRMKSVDADLAPPRSFRRRAFHEGQPGRPREPVDRQHV